MSASLGDLLWPASRLGEALEQLARHGRLSPRAVEMPTPPPGADTVPVGVLDRWVTDGATWLGLEAEAVRLPYADVADMVRGAGPALLHVPWEGASRLLLLVGPGRDRVPVLGPDGRVRRMDAETVRAALCADLEAHLREDLDALLAGAGVPPRRRGPAMREMLRQRLGSVPVTGGWMLRLPPGQSFRAQMVAAGLHRRLAALVGAQLAQYTLALLAWWVVGHGALEGRLDRGLLSGWALLLFTLVPVRLVSVWSSGLLTVDLGALVKQRLLTGALRMDPEAIRHEGAGQLLGRVIESEALEALMLSVGFVSLSSVLELVVVAGVLLRGAGGALATGLFALWVLLSVAAGVAYFARVRRQADTRLAMTHDLVERMVGQRTRLAQESPARWHDGEDAMVARYLDDSAALDRATRLIAVTVPRGWLVVGVVGLAPSLLAGGASAGVMAVGVGGVLMAYGALRKLLGALTGLSGVLIAWRQVRPLFEAAPRREGDGAPVFAMPHAEGAGTVLDAHGLAFRYRAGGESVLHGVSLRVESGDRLLLEGGSGGGKSTLASLLAGLRRPESGLLLLRGLDWQTLGAEGWRKRVVAAPQFHENHVFSGTMAFNLLMGGHWPPLPQQLDAAEAVCRELDLGPLLDRMPAGLQQMVGETGWQLSHGERSRLFMARALLQGADLVVLDESFAALDPETLQRCLACVLRRARTVLVIAHP